MTSLPTPTPKPMPHGAAFAAECESVRRAAWEAARKNLDAGLDPAAVRAGLLGMAAAHYAHHREQMEARLAALEAAYVRGVDQAIQDHSAESKP